MGSTRNSFLFTYQTTRPVKCLYFDGASGVLGDNGTMDTQMLFLYGNITGPPGKNSSADFLWDEYGRAEHLCAWLRDVSPSEGIEGVVRMSTGFELIWCDFDSPSVRLVSRFNVSVPLLGYNRTSLLPKKVDRDLFVADEERDLPAPDWEIDWEHEPFVASQQWDWFTSASRSYSVDDLASAREPSIRLLDADFVSLYSPVYEELQSRLNLLDREHLNLTADGLWLGVSDGGSRRKAVEALGRRRARHSVGVISPQEVARYREEMVQMVRRVTKQDHHHDVSWSHTCDLITDQFSKRLLRFQHLLQHGHLRGDESPVEVRRRFALLRERAHALLMPFFDYSPEMNYQSSLDRCKGTYLPWAVQSDGDQRLHDHFVGQAIEEVLDGICSVVIGVGTSIERMWLQDFNGPIEKASDERLYRLRAETRIWKDKIEELTAWLGWAPHWMSCDRLCAWDVSTPYNLPFDTDLKTEICCHSQEECYIPMWPVFRQLSPQKPAYGNRAIDPKELEHDLWNPRCVKIKNFVSK
ncbi:MAG: hypothetical protein Q9195_005392 [Heterodermia aff. obscurata]